MYPRPLFFIIRNHDEHRIEHPDGSTTSLVVTTPDDTGAVVTLRKTEVVPQSAVRRATVEAVEEASHE